MIFLWYYWEGELLIQTAKPKDFDLHDLSAAVMIVACPSLANHIPKGIGVCAVEPGEVALPKEYSYDSRSRIAASIRVSWSINRVLNLVAVRDKKWPSSGIGPSRGALRDVPARLALTLRPRMIGTGNGTRSISRNGITIFSSSVSHVRPEGI